MRVKTFKGIRKVKDVITAVEDKHDFNGLVRRIFEPCRYPKIKPNALVFMFEGQEQGCINVGMPFGCENDGDRMILGNLTAEDAESIIDVLMKTGYADLTCIKLQKQEMLVESYKLDNGVSGAYIYTCQGFNTFTNLGNAFGGIFQPVQMPSPDEDDGVESLDDDVIRKRIYEQLDFTMAELVAMDRDELERLYAQLKEGENE